MISSRTFVCSSDSRNHTVKLLLPTLLSLAWWVPGPRVQAVTSPVLASTSRSCLSRHTVASSLPVRSQLQQNISVLFQRLDTQFIVI